MQASAAPGHTSEVSPIKEFATAAKAETQQARSEVLEFKVDDDVLHAHRPTPAQLAVMMTSLTDYANNIDRVASTIDFFLGLLDRDDAALVTRRLMDRDDNFELEQVTDIVSWLMSEWAGRPFTSSFDSPSSPTSDGPRSTDIAQPEGSILSAFVSTGSSTSSTPGSWTG
jgi:hypothetical protein